MKLTGPITLLLAALCIANSCFANCPLPDPELENAIHYRNGYATYLDPNDQALPFYLNVVSSGTGYLVDLEPFSRGIVSPYRNEVAPAWLTEDQCKKSIAWTKLQRSVAARLWGKEKKIAVPGALPVGFWTFDVPARLNGESNIYHLDFYIDENTDCPYMYRVRGIGITDAKFIFPPKP